VTNALSPAGGTPLALLDERLVLQKLLLAQRACVQHDS
jgi:hypothetical protein